MLRCAELPMVFVSISLQPSALHCDKSNQPLNAVDLVNLVKYSKISFTFSWLIRLDGTNVLY